MLVGVQCIAVYLFQQVPERLTTLQIGSNSEYVEKKPNRCLMI